MAYKDLTPKQRYDSAVKAGEEPWSPGTEIRKLVREKLGMDNENMAKGIELKAGKPSAEKSYELKPELKKKGGKVKAKCGCMSSGGKVSSASKRADGCATKGKTKGRLI